MIGGGRDRFSEIRREWSVLSVEDALKELRRVLEPVQAVGELRRVVE